MEKAVRRQADKKVNFLFRSVGCESMEAVQRGVARMDIIGDVDVSKPVSEVVLKRDWIKDSGYLPISLELIPLLSKRREKKGKAHAKALKTRR